MTWSLSTGKDGRKYLRLICISLTSRRMKTTEHICLMPPIFLVLTFNFIMIIKIDLISAYALFSQCGPCDNTQELFLSNFSPKFLFIHVHIIYERRKDKIPLRP